MLTQLRLYVEQNQKRPNVECGPQRGAAFLRKENRKLAYIRFGDSVPYMANAIVRFSLIYPTAEGANGRIAKDGGSFRLASSAVYQCGTGYEVFIRVRKDAVWNVWT